MTRLSSHDICIGDLLEVEAPLIAWYEDEPTRDFVFYDGYLTVVDCFVSVLGLDAIVFISSRGRLTTERGELQDKSTRVIFGHGPKVSTVLTKK